LESANVELKKYKDDEKEQAKKKARIEEEKRKQGIYLIANVMSRIRV